jgi:hypothetical protein
MVCPHEIGETIMEKELVATALRATAMMMGAVTAISVHEMWYTKGDNSNIRPSQNPNRKEGVFFIVETQDGMWDVIVPITRINGVPSIPVEIPELEKAPTAKGRFAHFLKHDEAGELCPDPTKN